MPIRHRLFIYHYLQCFNATEAARRSGYKDSLWLRHFAQKLTTKSHIREAIREGIAAITLTPAEILARISAIADGSIEDVYDVSEGGTPALNLAKAKARGVLGIIKGFEYDAEGRPKVTMHDKLKALELLAKVHGLFADAPKVEDPRAANLCRETMQLAMADPAKLLLMIQLAEQLRDTRPL